MSWDDNNDDYQGDEVETWFIYDIEDRDNESNDNEIDSIGFMRTPEIGEDVLGYRIVALNKQWNYIYVRR